MDEPRGWLSEAEGNKLAELARGKRVLEVGSYAGRSTCRLAASAEFVLAVDPHDHGQGDTFSELVGNLSTRRLAHKVGLMKARVEDIHLPPGLFELGFNDASHLFRPMLAEIEAMLPALTCPAVLAIHDYRNKDWPEVEKACNNLFHREPDELVGSLAVYRLAGPPAGHVLNLVTPLSRLELLPKLVEAVPKCAGPFELRWWVAPDAEKVKFSSQLPGVPGAHCVITGYSGGWGGPGRRACLERITGGWVAFLDDDTLPEPGYGQAVWDAAREHPEADVLVFDQLMSRGKNIRLRAKDAVKGGMVDTGMYVFRRGTVQLPYWSDDYDADTSFFRDMIGAPGIKVVAVSRAVSRYNATRKA